MRLGRPVRMLSCSVRVTFSSGHRRVLTVMSAPHRAVAPASAERPVTYTISDLAREFALTTRAIRFYEDSGLLMPVRKGRARIYGERERVRVKLILRGKRLGLALSEIGELLDLYEIAGNESAQLAKFLAILADRRGRLMQQKEDIDAVLVEIDGIERECRRRLKEQAAAARPARAAGREASVVATAAARVRDAKHD